MYSYSGISNQAYPTIYAPHPHTHSTSSGGYGGYGQNTHQDFVLDTNTVQQGLSAESIYHLNTPAHSPRHSSLNSFDPQPPVLSSTSDSGASIRSNLSSAIGSPSMSDHHNKEWNHIQPIAPSIIHQDNFQIDTFAISGFECEPVMAPKYPGYVGESERVSSPQLFSAFSSVNVIPVSSLSTTESPASVAAQSWRTRTENSGNAHSQRLDSPFTGPFAAHIDLDDDACFKPPATPASRIASFSAAPIETHISKPRKGSISYSPFFSQSSGTYGAPLGFSCRFPYQRFQLLFLLLS